MQVCSPEADLPPLILPAVVTDISVAPETVSPPLILPVVVEEVSVAPAGLIELVPSARSSSLPPQPGFSPFAFPLDDGGLDADGLCARLGINGSPSLSPIGRVSSDVLRTCPCRRRWKCWSPRLSKARQTWCRRWVTQDRPCRRWPVLVDIPSCVRRRPLRTRRRALIGRSWCLGGGWIGRVRSLSGLGSAAPRYKWELWGCGVHPWIRCGSIRRTITCCVIGYRKYCTCFLIVSFSLVASLYEVYLSSS